MSRTMVLLQLPLLLLLPGMVLLLLLGAPQLGHAAATPASVAVNFLTPLLQQQPDCSTAQLYMDQVQGNFVWVGQKAYVPYAGNYSYTNLWMWCQQVRDNTNTGLQPVPGQTMTTKSTNSTVAVSFSYYGYNSASNKPFSQMFATAVFTLSASPDIKVLNGFVFTDTLQDAGAYCNGTLTCVDENPDSSSSALSCTGSGLNTMCQGVPYIELPANVDANTLDATSNQSLQVLMQFGQAFQQRDYTRVGALLANDWAAFLYYSAAYAPDGGTYSQGATAGWYLFENSDHYFSLEDFQLPNVVVVDGSDVFLMGKFQGSTLFTGKPTPYPSTYVQHIVVSGNQLASTSEWADGLIDAQQMCRGRFTCVTRVSVEKPWFYNRGDVFGVVMFALVVWAIGTVITAVLYIKWRKQQLGISYSAPIKSPSQSLLGNEDDRL